MTNAQYIPGVAELGRKNQPNGYVGIDSSGDVLGTFAQRRDTADNIAGIVLKNGELAFTTDTQETFIGDGVTAGGKFLWQKPQSAWGIARETVSQSVPPDSGNSFQVPRRAGAVYQIHIDASFESMEATANYALRIDQGHNGPYNFRFDGYASWYNRETEGSFIEGRRHGGDDLGIRTIIMMPMRSENLSVMFAGLAADLRILVPETPGNDNGMFSIGYVNRQDTGGNATIGFCSYSVQRIA